MSALNDDCWLLIFERLNLNERASLRLACKRFRTLCDQIKIHKLIIFHRTAPLSGRLQYTNEPYSLESTVYVVDLRKFFSNEQITVNQMKLIKTLVIYGDVELEHYGSGFEVNVKSKFEQLNHLEVHHCNFLSPIILSSTKIKYLVLEETNMRALALVEAKAEAINKKALKVNEKRTLDDTLSYYALGLEQFQSRGLKYLSMTYEVNEILSQKLLESDHFQHLEVADLWVPMLRFAAPILMLARKGICPKLRKLNLMIRTENFDETVDFIDQLDLTGIFSWVKDDLTVRLFGLRFDRRHKSAFVNFLRPFGRRISVLQGSLSIFIDQPTYLHIKKWNEKHELDHFYKTVGMLLLIDRFKSGDQLDPIFRRFTQCCTISVPPGLSPVQFEKYLNAFAGLKMIIMSENWEKPLYGNQLLNLIAKQCPQLECLLFDAWKEIDFSFLSHLQRLTYLQMMLAFAFPQSTLIDFLSKHRDLSKFEVCCVQSNFESKSALSALKKLVNETFADRFKARNLAFYIEIHTKKADQYIRCVLKGHHEPLGQNRADEMRMFSFIKRVNAAKKND